MNDLTMHQAEQIRRALVAMTAERDALREALRVIEGMAGAAGYGEVDAKPIAEYARRAYGYRPEDHA